jgi:hypothetical protein
LFDLRDSIGKSGNALRLSSCFPAFQIEKLNREIRKTGMVLASLPAFPLSRWRNSIGKSGKQEWFWPPFLLSRFPD